MTAPRIEIDLDKVESNTRALVERLERVGITVTGVTKAALGSPGVGAAMLRGGAVGLGDSRLPNLARLAGLEGVEGAASRTLVRTPMLSQVGQVVLTATRSLNTDLTVLRGLDQAAARHRRVHDVVLMVELGDLREGIAVQDMAAAVGSVLELPSLRLVGVGANLACQSGVVPDPENMGILSGLVETLEAHHGLAFTVVSGGNSANLDWALGATSVGRVNDLRIGEAILLGVEPLARTPVPGLHTDAFGLFGEIIEIAVKPAQPWGTLGQTAFGAPVARAGTGKVRQGIVALGRQDTDIDGLVPPPGVTVVGMSSDHLVVDLGDYPATVGDELRFQVGYGGLVRAMTSPFVTKVERVGLPSRPAGPAGPEGPAGPASPAPSGILAAPVASS